MPRGDDDVVELLGIHPVGLQVVDRDREIALVLVVIHHPHRGAEPDPVPHARLLHAALDIVEQHRPRGVGRDLLAEMLFEGIIREFQPFLRPVRPKVAVHGTMHRFAVLIQPGPPRVASPTRPSSPASRNRRFRGYPPPSPSPTGRPELGKPRRPGADHRNALLHITLHVIFLVWFAGRLNGGMIVRQIIFLA